MMNGIDACAAVSELDALSEELERPEGRPDPDERAAPAADAEDEDDGPAA